MVRGVIDNLNSLLNIKLEETQSDGDIAFNNINMEDDVGGFSFFPSEHPIGGDVFLSNDIYISYKENTQNML